MHIHPEIRRSAEKVAEHVATDFDAREWRLWTLYFLQELDRWANAEEQNAAYQKMLIELVQDITPRLGGGGKW